MLRKEARIGSEKAPNAVFLFAKFEDDRGVPTENPGAGHAHCILAAFRVRAHGLRRGVGHGALLFSNFFQPEARG